MKVHRSLGYGFPEIIYRRCLIIELRKLNLNCLIEAEKNIYYDGECVGKRRFDLVVENKILVELKAVSEIDSSYYNQVINYLRIFKIEVGLLINFGKRNLEFRRFVNSDFIS